MKIAGECFARVREDFDSMRVAIEVHGASGPALALFLDRAGKPEAAEEGGNAGPGCMNLMGGRKKAARMEKSEFIRGG